MTQTGKNGMHILPYTAGKPPGKGSGGGRKTRQRGIRRMQWGKRIRKGGRNHGK